MDIEVITSKDFDESDLGEIKQLFEDVSFEIRIDNERMSRKSMEPPPAIWVTVFIPAALWVANQFFSGFFNRMGGDAYDKFKDVIKKVLEKRKRDQDTQLRIHVRKDKNMIIVPLPDDKDELKIALDTLPKFLDDNPDLNEWINFENGEWKRLRGR